MKMIGLVAVHGKHGQDGVPWVPLSCGLHSVMTEIEIAIMMDCVLHKAAVRWHGDSCITPAES
jgi:hypothetical protein